MERIETGGGDSVKNGFLIGAGIGFVMGAVALAGLQPCEKSDGTFGSCGLGPRLGAGVLVGLVYGVIGAGFDALIQRRKVLYQSPIRKGAVDVRQVIAGIRVRW